MKNLLKKIVLVIISSFLLFSSSLSLAATAHAQSTWYSQNPFEWYVKVYDEESSPPNEIFGERYTAAQVQWVFWSLFATAFNLPFTMLGVSPGPSVCVAKLALGITDPPACLTAIGTFITEITAKILPFFPSDTGRVNTNSGLAQSPAQNSIWKKIFLEDRPISGIAYVRNISRKLKLVPEAKAADSFGFSRLTVIQDLWKFSRNVAYFFFVLAIIITAFMIMFKVKISPQAVVSIQSALPKIIMTLILVTFSYAIAGFLIDIMYVIMGIFSLILSTSGVTLITNPSINFTIIDGFGTGGLAILLYWIIFLVLYVVATMAAYLSALLSLGATGVIWALILGVFTIILFFILIIDLFRITFALFKALAGFYLAVILGPFQLAIGALPQSRNALSSWLKSLIAKLAVFPATGILFYFAILFICKSILVSTLGMAEGNVIVELLRKIPYLDSFLFPSGASADTLWGPPMLHNSASATSIAFILMALGCIMIIPKVQKAIESALAGRPFDMETAIGESVKRPISIVGGVTESVGKSLGPTPPGAVVSGLGSLIQQAAR